MAIDEFVKELAASLGKESAKSTLGFINSILEPPAKELGGIFRDKLRFYRLKNQIKIIQKTQKLVGESRSNNGNMKLLDLVLESGGVENNNNIQEKWASLLADSLISPKGKIDSSLSYAEILKYLSAIEAQALDVLYLNTISLHDAASVHASTITREQLSEAGCEILDDKEFTELANNLVRRGIVKYWQDESHIRLTSFGIKFMESVTPSEKREKYEWKPI